MRHATCPAKSYTVDAAYYHTAAKMHARRNPAREAGYVQIGFPLVIGLRGIGGVLVGAFPPNRVFVLPRLDPPRSDLREVHRETVYSYYSISALLDSFLETFLGQSKRVSQADTECKDHV